MSGTALRACAVALPVALVAAAAQVTAGVRGGAELQRASGLDVVTPVDGAAVDGDFLLTWRPGGSQERFAVVVDAPLPGPGARVEATRSTVLTDLTSLRLQLGDRHGGSPSARRWHRITVLPVGSDGRRLGETTAVVHVRSRA